MVGKMSSGAWIIWLEVNQQKNKYTKVSRRKRSDRDKPSKAIKNYEPSAQNKYLRPLVSNQRVGRMKTNQRIQARYAAYYRYKEMTKTRGEVGLKT